MCEQYNYYVCMIQQTGYIKHYIKFSICLLSSYDLYCIQVSAIDTETAMMLFRCDLSTIALPVSSFQDDPTIFADMKTCTQYKNRFFINYAK